MGSVYDARAAGTGITPPRPAWRTEMKKLLFIGVLIAGAACAEDGPATLTAAAINNGTLPAYFTNLSTTGMALIGGNVYSNYGGTTNGCLHLGAGPNAANDTGLCGSASGINQFWNLWTAAGSANQAATTDGSGNLTWSNLGSIAGTLAAAQFPSAYAMSSHWYLSWAPVSSTSGSPTLYTLTAPAHTGLTVGTEAQDLTFNLARIVQFTGGSPISAQRAFYVSAPTYAFTAANTVSTAATMAISGAPVPGTNATITQSVGLWIQDGAAGGTQAVGFRADAPTGGTNNWATYLNGNVSIGSGSIGNAGDNTLFVQGPSTSNTRMVVEESSTSPGASPFSVENSAGAVQFGIDTSNNTMLIGAASQHVNRVGGTNKDAWGTATLAGGTVAVTFTTAYNTPPVCVANSQGSTNALKVAPSTTTVVFTSSSASDNGKISYVCFGDPN